MVSTLQAEFAPPIAKKVLANAGVSEVTRSTRAAAIFTNFIDMHVLTRRLELTVSSLMKFTH